MNPPGTFRTASGEVWLRRLTEGAGGRGQSSAGVSSQVQTPVNRQNNPRPRARSRAKLLRAPPSITLLVTRGRVTILTLKKGNKRLETGR